MTAFSGTSRWRELSLLTPYSFPWFLVPLSPSFLRGSRFITGQAWTVWMPARVFPPGRVLFSLSLTSWVTLVQSALACWTRSTLVFPLLGRPYCYLWSVTYQCYAHASLHSGGLSRALGFARQFLLRLTESKVLPICRTCIKCFGKSFMFLSL
jgi:hypothetical protein